MKLLRSIKTIALIMMLAFMVSCASSSHTHKHKKLKRGKPIPCPLKDC